MLVIETTLLLIGVILLTGGSLALQYHRAKRRDRLAASVSRDLESLQRVDDARRELGSPDEVIEGLSKLYIWKKPQRDSLLIVMLTAERDGRITRRHWKLIEAQTR